MHVSNSGRDTGFFMSEIPCGLFQSIHTDSGISDHERLLTNNFPLIIWRHQNIPAVAQLVEAMHYKPEGRGLDSRWCHWNFSLT
jgi:hypothetical protein